MGHAVVYVDGMNLYHGLKAKYGRKYLWLDLYALATELRRPDTIIKVRYFTTIVVGEPEAARRVVRGTGASASRHVNTAHMRRS